MPKGTRLAKDVVAMEPAFIDVEFTCPYCGSRNSASVYEEDEFDDVYETEEECWHCGNDVTLRFHKSDIESW